MRRDFAAKLRRGAIGRRTPGGSALVYLGALLTARPTGRCVASAFFLARPGNIDPAMAQNHRVPTASLVRRLGLGDAVVLGLGSMIGAGVFAASAPAARPAGSGLLIGLAERRWSPTATPPLRPGWRLGIPSRAAPTST